MRDETLIYDEKVVDGIRIRTKESKTNSVRLVLQKNVQNDKYTVQEMEVKDGSWNTEDTLTPKAATEVLKNKTGRRKQDLGRFKSSRLKDADMVVPLDEKGQVFQTQDQFVNEIQTVDELPKTEKIKEEPVEEEDEDDSDDNEDHIIYELTSEDGYKAASKDINKLWVGVLNAVQEARMLHGMVPLANDPIGSIGLQMLGLTHSAISYLVEQLPGICLKN